MFTRVKPAIAARSTRRRRKPDQLSLERLDPRQVLSANPLAEGLTGGVEAGRARAMAAASTEVRVVAPVAIAAGIDVGGCATPYVNDLWRPIAQPSISIDARPGQEAIATVGFTAPDAGPLPFTWGTARRDGNVITLELEANPDFDFRGVRASVIQPHRHEYRLGTLPAGQYQLRLSFPATVFTPATTLPVQRFTVGGDDEVRILPVRENPVVWTKPIVTKPVVTKPVATKPVVAKPAPGSDRVVGPQVAVPPAAAARGFKVGMRVEAARKTGVAFRAVEIDGATQPTTREVRPGRLNVVVTNGVITRVASIG